MICLYTELAVLGILARSKRNLEKGIAMEGQTVKYDGGV
jgi:hypothetical protein